MTTHKLNGYEIALPEIPEGATDVVFIGDNEKYPTVFFRHKDGFKYDMPAPTYPAEFVEWVGASYKRFHDKWAKLGEDPYTTKEPFFTLQELFQYWKNIQSKKK